jgi:ubiquinone/menaquinone biosynthesis C-methylase UbiE
MAKSVERIERVKRSKEIARATYDRMSRWYDLISGGAEKRFRELGLGMLRASKGEQILEIGFGTGHSLLSLASAVGDSGEIFGIDISQGMLSIANQRIERAGLASRVELVQGDGSKLPFASNRFTAVFMSFTLELFDTPEIPLVLHECYRVLQSRGRICVVGLSKEARIYSLELYEWFHRVMPALVDCRPIFVRRSLVENGFGITQYNLASMWSLPVEIVVAEKV